MTIWEYKNRNLDTTKNYNLLNQKFVIFRIKYQMENISIKMVLLILKNFQIYVFKENQSIGK